MLLARATAAIKEGIRRPFQAQALPLGYAALVLLALVLLALTEVGPDWRVLDTHGANLAAELFGILVTLLLVERILRWQRARELAPIRTVAARRLRRPVSDLVYLLTQMYKAASPPDAARHDSPAVLIEGWATEVPRLDFLRPAPVVPAASWHQHVARSARAIQHALDETLARYPEALGTEVVISAEAMTDHHIWKLLLQAESSAAARASLALTPPVPFMLELHSGGDNADLREFGARVQALVRATDALGADPIRVSSTDWRSDVAPTFASARWDGDLQEIDDPRTYLPRGPSDNLPQHEGRPRTASS